MFCREKAYQYFRLNNADDRDITQLKNLHWSDINKNPNCLDRYKSKFTKEQLFLILAIEINLYYMDAFWLAKTHLGLDDAAIAKLTHVNDGNTNGLILSEDLIKGMSKQSRIEYFAYGLHAAVSCQAPLKARQIIELARKEGIDLETILRQSEQLTKSNLIELAILNQANEILSYFASTAKNDCRRVFFQAVCSLLLWDNNPKTTVAEVLRFAKEFGYTTDEILTDSNTFNFRQAVFFSQANILIQLMQSTSEECQNTLIESDDFCVFKEAYDEVLRNNISFTDKNVKKIAYLLTYRSVLSFVERDPNKYVPILVPFICHYLNEDKPVTPEYRLAILRIIIKLQYNVAVNQLWNAPFSRVAINKCTERDKIELFKLAIENQSYTIFEIAFGLPKGYCSGLRVDTNQLGKVFLKQVKEADLLLFFKSAPAHTVWDVDLLNEMALKGYLSIFNYLIDKRQLKITSTLVFYCAAANRTDIIDYFCSNYKGNLYNSIEFHHISNAIRYNALVSLNHLLKNANVNTILPANNFELLKRAIDSKNIDIVHSLLSCSVVFEHALRHSIDYDVYINSFIKRTCSGDDLASICSMMKSLIRVKQNQKIASILCNEHLKASLYHDVNYRSELIEEAKGTDNKAFLTLFANEELEKLELKNKLLDLERRIGTAELVNLFTYFGKSDRSELIPVLTNGFPVIIEHKLIKTFSVLTSIIKGLKQAEQIPSQLFTVEYYTLAHQHRNQFIIAKFAEEGNYERLFSKLTYTRNQDMLFNLLHFPNVFRYALAKGDHLLLKNYISSLSIYNLKDEKLSLVITYCLDKKFYPKNVVELLRHDEFKKYLNLHPEIFLKLYYQSVELKREEMRIHLIKFVGEEINETFFKQFTNVYAQSNNENKLLLTRSSETLLRDEQLESLIFKLLPLLEYVDAKRYDNKSNTSIFGIISRRLAQAENLGIIQKLNHKVLSQLIHLPNSDILIQKILHDLDSFLGDDVITGLNSILIRYIRNFEYEKLERALEIEGVKKVFLDQTTAENFHETYKSFFTANYHNSVLFFIKIMHDNGLEDRLVSILKQAKLVIINSLDKDEQELQSLFLDICSHFDKEQLLTFFIDLIRNQCKDNYSTLLLDGLENTLSNKNRISAKELLYRFLKENGVQKSPELSRVFSLYPEEVLSVVSDSQDYGLRDNVLYYPGIFFYAQNNEQYKPILNAFVDGQIEILKDEENSGRRGKSFSSDENLCLLMLSRWRSDLSFLSDWPKVKELARYNHLIEQDKIDNTLLSKILDGSLEDAICFVYLVSDKGKLPNWIGYLCQEINKKDNNFDDDQVVLKYLRSIATNNSNFFTNTDNMEKRTIDSGLDQSSTAVNLEQHDSNDDIQTQQNDDTVNMEKRTIDSGSDQSITVVNLEQHDNSDDIQPPPNDNTVNMEKRTIDNSSDQSSTAVIQQQQSTNADNGEKRKEDDELIRLLNELRIAISKTNDQSTAELLCRFLQKNGVKQRPELSRIFSLYPQHVLNVAIDSKNEALLDYVLFYPGVFFYAQNKEHYKPILNAFIDRQIDFLGEEHAIERKGSSFSSGETLCLLMMSQLRHELQFLSDWPKVRELAGYYNLINTRNEIDDTLRSRILEGSLEDAICLVYLVSDKGKLPKILESLDIAISQYSNRSLEMDEVQEYLYSICRIYTGSNNFFAKTDNLENRTSHDGSDQSSTTVNLEKHNSTDVIQQEQDSDKDTWEKQKRDTITQQPGTGVDSKQNKNETDIKQPRIAPLPAVGQPPVSVWQPRQSQVPFFMDQNPPQSIQNSVTGSSAQVIYQRFEGSRLQRMPIAQLIRLVVEKHSRGKLDTRDRDLTYLRDFYLNQFSREYAQHESFNDALRLIAENYPDFIGVLNALIEKYPTTQLKGTFKNLLDAAETLEKSVDSYGPK